MFGNNKRYNTLDSFYKSKFNSKVFKVSLNQGCSCPNKDGNKGFGGCIYCKDSSGTFGGDKTMPLKAQFDTIRNTLHEKWKEAKYIAYFQAGSNTYLPLKTLKNNCEEVLTYKNIVGINIATRCDCINDETINYLEELSKKTYLTIELGLQSIHKDTIKLLNLCYTKDEFENTFKKLKEKNINVVVHIINGLPFETKDMMIDTVKYLNILKIDGIKIHMLYILKDTLLEKLYNNNNFHILTKDEYIDIVCEQLTYLDKSVIINRITGDPNKEELVEPKWLIKKFCVLNDIDKLMNKKNIYQGINS